MRRSSALLAVLALAAGCAAAPSADLSLSVVRTGGDGWRQLGVYRTNVPYTVKLAQDKEQLAAELTWHGITATVPGWDPDQEVVAFFNEGIGSSCPEVAVSQIVFADAGQRVYAVFADPVAAAVGNTPRVCTADLVGSQTVMVALARDHLKSPLMLALEEKVVGCHPDCGWGPTAITITLE